jgi:hypothetical protein
MAALTAHPAPRPRPVTPRVRVVEPDQGSPIDELGHAPDDGPPVPGPDARSAARTAAAVGASLVLLIGVMVIGALGASEVVRAGVEWFMAR